jgi:hypothetical protein
MFKLAPANSFTYPVIVEQVSNGGAARKDKFTATFKRLSTQEVTNWMERMVDASQDGYEAQTQVARELCHEVMEGWHDVTDVDGGPVPFSTDALTQALDIHPVAISIATAWVDAMRGGAKRKNS